MLNSFNSLAQLTVNSETYNYYSLKSAESHGLKNLHRLPFSLKVLLENLLRHEDGQTVKKTDIQALVNGTTDRNAHLVAYRPSRVLMQDFTGVPALVDLATMRDALASHMGDPNKINPLCPVDLVIDHSIQVDHFGNEKAFHDNCFNEMQRNHERYTFLKWAQQSFDNLQVVPPGSGICHQVNLEYLSKVLLVKSHHGRKMLYPDTLVGTDSHTTMINGVGVLGWGVGGIEAEAVMLGQPIFMLIPKVIGFRLEGRLREGVTATDLVLTVTEILRKKSVVGKFVEFYGSGLQSLTVEDRATISNMSPEYGATCSFFPIDSETINYLKLSGRNSQEISCVESYTRVQGLWYDNDTPEPIFADRLTLDLSSVEQSLSGPKRPQDKVTLSTLPAATIQAIKSAGKSHELNHPFKTSAFYTLHHGDVVIAAITSCTNTSNPRVMLAAGLMAKKAVEHGLQCKPWVKTSLAPGSKVVTNYLQKTGLMTYLEQLGFYVTGYGCTTCIGNSGPLLEPVAKTIANNDLLACSVLSGNRNFEGRIHPQVKANWLASPPLVIAFALAGTTKTDLMKQSIGQNAQGESVYLRDIWPNSAEISDMLSQISDAMFRKEYAEVFNGNKPWQAIAAPNKNTYQWQSASTYIKPPPFFKAMRKKPSNLSDIKSARILAVLGDSITTDHISPAGVIKPNSPAGEYLKAHGIPTKDFNSYGSRRGNHQVMVRGTFANIRIHNEIAQGKEGGLTTHYPSRKLLSIYDAAMQYQKEKVPLVIIAGKEYGVGSSRDWAAKGTVLLGVKAVIAESFERIHRSNLIGMGVLLLEFKAGVNRKTLQLTGNERIDILDLERNCKPGADIKMTIFREDNRKEDLFVRCRIDTKNELEYYRHGGILQYVLRKLL